MVTKKQLSNLGWSQKLIDAVFEAHAQIDWEKFERPPHEQIPSPPTATSNKMIAGESCPDSVTSWIVFNPANRDPDH